MSHSCGSWIIWVSRATKEQTNCQKKKKKKAVKKENVEINIKLSKGKSIVWREINKKCPQQRDNAVKGRLILNTKQSRYFKK